MLRQELEIFADYFQFYLQDDEQLGDLSDAWTEDAIKRMFAIGPGVVGIGTVRNMDVPVTIDVLEAEPIDDIGEWEHVVEGGLEVGTGRLVVAGSTDFFPNALRRPA